MKVILFVDGLIGSGKSTALEKYKKLYPNISVVQEPIDSWMQSGLLTKFYNDHKKYAFELQSFIMDSFAAQMELEFQKGANFILAERGHLACFTIFSYSHRQSGYLTEEEYKLMEDKFHAYNRDLRLKGYICDHIYLSVPIDTAMERLAQRDRGNEKSSVTKAYQQKFLDRYEQLCITPYTLEQLDVYVARINEMLKAEQLQHSIFSVM